MFRTVLADHLAEAIRTGGVPRGVELIRGPGR
jgi:hypothetical protein